jgi:hypothetical protein
MAKKTRLTDLQLVLLSHAAQHQTGNLLPLPEATAQDDERATKDLKSLLPQAARGSRGEGPLASRRRRVVG